MTNWSPCHGIATGLGRLTSVVEARHSARRALLAAHVLLFACALLLFYGAGAYGLEHESRDSLDWLAALLNLAMVVVFLGSLLCTTAFAFSRPRRLARHGARLGVAAALVGWPAACLLVVLAVVVSY